ncbi:MAG: tetratricopeptide repeat protein [Rheinheimera sp.]|nr:tetratricopeptide repeat protein [Rheinheimera sp.]
MNPQTPESRRRARAAYTRALNIAKKARLDALAIDTIHMFAFVDTAPADQLNRGLEALALVETSDQPEAKSWEASVRSNIGEALYELGRYDEAMTHFRTALALRENGTNQNAIRDAHWQIARVLRNLGRTDEALAIQLRLESESAATGDPKYYIFEELELLYRDKGSMDRANHYVKLVKSFAK